MVVWGLLYHATIRKKITFKESKENKTWITSDHFGPVGGQLGNVLFFSIRSK